MSEKIIEVFPGSLADLENMTGNEYEVMRDDNGNLLKIESKPFPPDGYMLNGGLEDLLRKGALRFGADAVVYAQYVPCINIKLNRLGTSRQRYTYFGYLVKLKKK